MFTSLSHTPVSGIPSLLNTLRPDSASIASSIKYHAEFTPLFAPNEFSCPAAFFAAAQSVRDSLIINWNATYDFYEKMNMKQAYYLSMEFLQVFLLVFFWLVVSYSKNLPSDRLLPMGI